MSELKIAYCIPAIYSVSGMERTLSVKANYFADILGYKIFIILTDGKGKKPAYPLSDKITIINLDVNFDKIYRYNLIFKTSFYLYKQIQFRRRLNKTLLEIRPDITVSMLRREINFINEIKDGSRKIGEMHFNKSNYRDFNTKGNFKGLKGFFAKLWMNQLVKNLKKLDKFIVLSEEDKAKWDELSNVSVVYNPLPEFPDKISDCSSKKVIAAGRFVRQKGFDMLLDSWAIVSAKYPDWTLSIYGNGSKDSYIEKAVKLGISQTCFLYDAVENLNEKFLESSIFAFSSRFEGFGMVITEAMACGLPPVAFACPCGPSEIIENGISGLLVEPENVRELADKICSLIEKDELRINMGKMARERSQRFKIDVIAKEWESIFNA